VHRDDETKVRQGQARSDQPRPIQAIAAAQTAQLGGRGHGGSQPDRFSISSKASKQVGMVFFWPVSKRYGYLLGGFGETGSRCAAGPTSPHRIASQRWVITPSRWMPVNPSLHHRERASTPSRSTMPHLSTRELNRANSAGWDSWSAKRGEEKERKQAGSTQRWPPTKAAMLQEAPC